MHRPSVIVRRFRVPVSIASAGILSLNFLAGCSKSPADTPPLNKNLGGSVVALPVSGTTDMGILKDQAGYKAAGGGPRGGGLSGSERDQVQELVNTLLKAIGSTDVNTILDSFVAEDVAALREQADALFATNEKVQALRATLVGKFGEEAVAQHEAEDIKKIADTVRIEVTDADNATITPNIMLGFLGPSKAAPTLAARRIDNAWKISLPISAEDVAGIVAFNKVVAAAVESVTKQVDEAKITALDQVANARMVAVAGGGSDSNAADPTASQPQSDDSKPIGDAPIDDAGGNPRTPKSDEEEKDEGGGGGG